MNRKNCGCHHSDPCGCDKPHIVGCEEKVDLLCTFYSGEELEPLDIQKGDDGNTVIKKINDYLHDLPDSEYEPTLIQSIGGKVDIYKGLSSSLIHEVKSIQGIEGVIVRDAAATECSNGGDFIQALIDKEWLKNYIIYLFTSGEIDICELIAHCNTNPPDNEDPVVQNIVFNIPNRSSKVFTETDFAYTDPEGDMMTSVKAIGNVEDYRLSNNPYVSDAEVFVFNLQQGLFKFVAKDTNLAYTSTVQYRAKDSQGNWSNAANLTINVAEKIIPNFSPVTFANLLRGVSNTKTATVNYTNGNGQTLTAGQVLYTIGTSGQEGYIRIYVQSTTVLSSAGGTFNIVIVTTPYSTVSGNPASVTYTIDSGVGVVNLTYGSAPVVEDIVKGTPYNTPVFFTPTDFTAHFTDLDNDVTQVRALSNPDSLQGYKLSGNDYTGGWINIADTANLAFYPDATLTNANTKTNKWQAKDAQGNESL